jgi:hypothetical protein
MVRQRRHRDSRQVAAGCQLLTATRQDLERIRIREARHTMKAARRCPRERAPSPARCVQLSQCATSANCVCVLLCACVLCRGLFLCFFCVFFVFFVVYCALSICVWCVRADEDAFCGQNCRNRPMSSGSRWPLIHGSSEVQRSSRAIVQNTVHDGACMLSCVVYGMAGHTYDIPACDACMQSIFLVYGTTLSP